MLTRIRGHLGASLCYSSGGESRGEISSTRNGGLKADSVDVLSSLPPCF